MGFKSKYRNQVYVDLAKLREEEAELIQIVEALPEVKRLAGVQAAIAGLEKYAEATRQKTGARVIAADPESDFANLSLPKAAVRYLEKIATPQTPREIWDALSAGGLTLKARKPDQHVHSALKRHMNKNGRLQFIEGKWSLKPIDLAKGGIADGSLEKHRELTRAGIAHFKARTGATWGRRPTITAAQIEKFRDLLDTGRYSVSAASKEAGMSNAYFYMHKHAILAWTKNDPWPPPGGLVNEVRAKRRASMDERGQQLRLVIGGSND